MNSISRLQLDSWKIQVPDARFVSVFADFMDELWKCIVNARKVVK